MKSLRINILAGLCMTGLFTGHAFGQATMTKQMDGGKMPNKIEKANVPKPVIETHYREYPVTTYESWYGYPAFENESDWYGYNPYMYTDVNPEYYVVEFTRDETPHKVIYSKAGKRVATHRTMKKDAPMAVMSSLKNGPYKKWDLSPLKEEIYNDADKSKIYYRLIVTSSTESRALYFLANGKIVKDKKWN